MTNSEKATRKVTVVEMIISVDAKEVKGMDEINN